MNNEYNYEEYVTIKTLNIERIISNYLKYLPNKEETENILFDSLYEYENFINEEIKKLYASVNLYPSDEQLEIYLYRVNDLNVRNQIYNYYFELNILKTAISNLTIDENYERDHQSLEDILNNMNNDDRNEISNSIKYYENLYHDEIKYIGSGETCTVFSIGNKIIKFGALRRYHKIPYCLNIEYIKQYDKYSYMYITDKIETNNISMEDAKNMYNLLRNKGYVWLDVKKDNIGRQHNQLKILDDIDIYTEEDILSSGKYSILDYLSRYNKDLALLELQWLSNQNIDFNINEIDKYFNNQSPSTIALICELKDEYIKRQQKYQYNPSDDEINLFLKILMNKIQEYNIEEHTIKSK